MNTKEEHEHNWRAYGQPDGTIVCDGCNVGTDVNILIKSRESALLSRGFRDGLMWAQKDILEKVGKGKYKLQGKGVESGALIVRDDITLKLTKLDQLSKEKE